MKTTIQHKTPDALDTLSTSRIDFVLKTDLKSHVYVHVTFELEHNCVPNMSSEVESRMD